MIFGTRVRKRTAQGTLSLFAIAGLASTANAQTYLIDVSNIGDAVVVEQANPEYPGGIVPRRQEGWVRMHIVIGPDGEAIDPVIVDSSGGQPFEAEAIKAASTWRFEAPESGVEKPNNLVNIRTRIRRGEDAPSSDFIRDYRNIMRQVVGEQIESAREMVDETQEKGGWNLYESTMLWLLMGRIESAEGDGVEKLEAYRRALSIGTRRSLGGNDRLGLLGRIFRAAGRVRPLCRRDAHLRTAQKTGRKQRAGRGTCAARRGNRGTIAVCRSAHSQRNHLQSLRLRRRQAALVLQTRPANILFCEPRW